MPFWPTKNARHGADENGRTPLWHFAEHGDLVGVLTALSAGADPNQADDAGYTPLHAAVHHGHLEVIKHLISVSNNVNVADKHGNGPLWTAVSITTKERKIEIVELLLAAGSDPDHQNIYGKSPRQVVTGTGPEFEKLFNRS
ncbi:MAG: ankyrin repeat domain-containing protein [Arenimonas sp.]